MMKRILLSALLWFICCISACINVNADDAGYEPGDEPWNAHTGEVVGHIYSTDILAVIGGNQVKSFNIGGKTAVVVENDYDDYWYNGMNYSYDDIKRELRVYGEVAAPNGVILERGAVGEITGDVYASDIKVYFNDIPVKGYNIGGKTALCIEDIGGIDDSPNAVYGYSKYCARSRWDEESRVIYLDYAADDSEDRLEWMVNQYIFTYNDNVMTAEYDNMNDVRCQYFGNYSESFKNEPNIIKPLYLKLDGEAEQIGICYPRILDDDDDIVILEKKLYDIEGAAKKLNDYRAAHAEKISCDDALKRFDNGIDYETITSAETEDYILLAVRRLDIGQQYGYGTMSYISVKKVGGYTVVGTGMEYTQITLEKSGVNAVDVSEYPFAGPHGDAVTMVSTLNLDWDIYN